MEGIHTSKYRKYVCLNFLLSATVTHHPPRCSCKSPVSVVTLGGASQYQGLDRCLWLVAGHDAVWLLLSHEDAVQPGGRLCPWRCTRGSWTPSGWSQTPDQPLSGRHDFQAWKALWKSPWAGWWTPGSLGPDNKTQLQMLIRETDILTTKIQTTEVQKTGQEEKSCTHRLYNFLSNIP